MEGIGRKVRRTWVMIPTQVRIRAYIRLSKLHTAETEMPILKA